MWNKYIYIIIFMFLNLSIGEETAVLILARGGSRGIKLKNLQFVGNKSLLQRAINSARLAGCRDITVSTDHPLIAIEALKYKAKVYCRNRITATDWAPSIWGAAEFISNRSDISILVLIQATSPFTRPEDIRTALTKLQGPRNYDCVFSVTRNFKLRWKEVQGLVRPLNFKIESRPRRQDWNGELLETGAFYIARRSLIEKGYFQNDK